MFYPPFEKSGHSGNILPVFLIALLPFFIFCHIDKKKFVYNDYIIIIKKEFFIFLKSKLLKLPNTKSS